MKERSYYLLLGAFALLLASAPYLYGWLHTPPGLNYSGLTSNIDDCFVYFTWINESARGHFLHHNLFSTETQTPKLFYLWFAFLGGLSKVTATPLAFHAGRVLGGIGLLLSVVWLLHEAISTERARKLAFAFVCFSSGFGWLFGGYDPARGFTLQPIDTFQPEAITFLSLYYSPLFAPMTALMVVFFAALLKSERTGKLISIWPACLSGLVLGNSHTYDVVHLLAVAWVWRIVSRPPTNKFSKRQDWLPLFVATAACLPTTLYTGWASRVDPLFKARAWTNEGTLTPALWWVLLGFGLPILFALFSRKQASRSQLFLFIWFVVATSAAYLPVPWQRKLLMGAHLPICLLAGIGLDAIAQKLSGDFPKIAMLFGVLLTTPSNILYLLADIGRLESNTGTTAQRPYLSDDEAKAMAYLRDNGGESDAVLVAHDPASIKRYPGRFQPHLSGAIAATGHIVYNGHWSETLAYPKKDLAAFRFFRADSSDDERVALLRDNKIVYVVYLNALAAGPVSDDYTPVAWTENRQPSYLTPVYLGSEVTIYRALLDL
jgi:hypothetical protein